MSAEISKLIAAILILLLAGVTSPITDNGFFAFGEALKYAPDEFIVKFKADANKMEISNFNAANEVSVLTAIEDIGYQVLKIPPTKTVSEMVASYNQNANVEWAEPNYILHTAAVPNDSDYQSNQKWYYDLVLAESAWSVETGDSDVIIAIVDSGVDLDHPDLAVKIWQNAGEIPDNETDDDGNGYADDVYGYDFVGSDDGDDGNQDDHDAIPDVFAGDPSVGDGEDQDNDGTADDGVSHGTMVAGIAAAATNNGEGIAGAAWGCKIMAVRVINPEGNAYTSDLFAGIIYAADSGADIINLSIDSYEIDGGGLFTLEFAIDYAHDTKGCVVVAAAGNNNTHPIVHPAQFSDTIAVGASDYSNPDGKASFSNWGTGDTNDRLVDVVAPGVNIYSTAVEPVSGNPTYSLGEGTSFSAPIVSGLAALVISRTGITNDPEAIRGYINDGASDLPGDPPNYPDCWDGNGMVKFAQTDSLPVKLSAFTATKTQDGEAILRWMAETEVNNVGWNIYRSVSKAGPFTNIDFVFGAGNSAFPNDYQYVDKNVLNGVTYFYYIEDVDIQGNKSKSAIVQTTKTAMKSETVRSETVRIAPAEFQLFQNYPNPFNPATWIPYQLVESAEVVIRIYNASGQLVRTLNLGNKRAGFYISREESVSWNGKSNQGDQVASGVYFYRIRAGSFTSMRRMVLMK